MTIGVIACLYGQPELLDGCLSPWIELKEELNIKITAVHGLFKENAELGLKDDNVDLTYSLSMLQKNKKIDFLYIQNPIYSPNPIYQTEAQIRDKGLQWLLSQDVDYIALLDLDEKYSKDEIRAIIHYIQRDPFIAVYHIEFKNLVFDSNHYVKGFNPRRIWKIDYNSYRLDRINFDNDCLYKHKITGEEKQDILFSNKNIPITVVNPLHFSWNDIERSRSKINYQLKHFSTGCSYKIENNKIVFDMEFFKRTGQNPPQVYEIGNNS